MYNGPYTILSLIFYVTICTGTLTTDLEVHVLFHVVHIICITKSTSCNQHEICSFVCRLCPPSLPEIIKKSIFGANVHHVPGLCLLGISGAPYISIKVWLKNQIFTFSTSLKPPADGAEKGKMQKVRFCLRDL